MAFKSLSSQAKLVIPCQESMEKCDKWGESPVGRVGFWVLRVSGIV